MDFDSVIDKVAETAKPPASMARVSPVPGRVAHIDGDGLGYWAAGKDTMPAGQCRQNVIRRVEKVMRLTGATTVVMHLTCGGSDKGARGLVAVTKPYQGNRRGSKKPKNWQAARDVMTDHDGSRYIPKIWRDREADDGMAYYTHTTYERKGLQVIHADDKDMRMFAGLHLNWRTFHLTEVPRGAYEVWGDDGLLYGHKWFWMQMVMGDGVDNIPGLPSCGEVTAQETLEGTTDNTSAYAAVAALYAARKGEGWEHYMVEQAALLWMRTDRHADPRDFLTLGVFPTNVQEAAQEMAERVRLQREYLESLKE